MGRPRFDREILVEDSKVVSSIRYDPKQNLMDVSFMSGSRFRYLVFPLTFAHILNSRSVGEALNSLVLKNPSMRVRRLPTKTAK